VSLTYFYFQISDGSLYSTSFGQNDMVVGCLNQSELSLTNSIQNGTFQGESAYSIAFDTLGNIFVGGYTYGDWFDQNQGGKDLLLMKYDSDLNLIWGWQFGGNKQDVIYGIAPNLINEVWIGGESDSNSLFEPSDESGDNFIAKYDGITGTQILSLQSEISSSTTETVRSLAVDTSNNLYFGGSSYGLIFGTNYGDRDYIIAKWGCDPGYINVVSHCESTTFSPTFTPSFFPTFDPTFDPTFVPTQTIIYFDQLTHSLGVFWSQAYQPSDLNLNYSSSSQPPLFGSHISPPFNSSSNQQQEDPLLFSSPGVDGSENERGRLSLMNDPLNFSSFEEAENFLSNENEIISSLDWMVDYFNSQTFIFYSSNNSIFMSNIINNKIENITQIPHQLNGSYVFSPSSSTNNNNDDDVILDQVGNSFSSFMGLSGSFYFLPSSFISEEFGESLKIISPSNDPIGLWWDQEM